MFLAQATNTPFGLAEQIELLLILLVTSKGAAGIAGAAFVPFRRRSRTSAIGSDQAKAWAVAMAKRAGY